MAKTKYIVAFDFESSDLLKNGGKPVEIAAMLLDIKTRQYVDRFHRFMHLEPGEEMAKEAQETHGYTPEWLLQNGESRELARVGFLRWLDSHGVTAPWTQEMIETHRGQVMALGHNSARFDCEMMDQWLGPIVSQVFTYSPLDTLPLARFVNDACISAFGYGSHPFKNPENGHPSVRLSHIAASMGKDPSGAHGAAWDIARTVELYEDLVRNYKEDLVAAAAYRELIAKKPGTAAPQELPEGVYHCPSCGARTEAMGVAGPGEYIRCFICGKDYHLQELPF